MVEEIVLFQLRGEVGIITINRPEALNTLSSHVFEELIIKAQEVERSKACKVLIITGAGDKSFVAGADISQMVDFSPREALAFGEKARIAMNAIAGLRVPVIAAINGFALGGGFELALACDIRVASTKAVFGFPEVTLGIIPGSGGTQRLINLVGTGLAKELIFTGKRVKAETALAWGLLNRVVEPDQLVDTVIRLAEEIAGNSSTAVQEAKSSINFGLEASLQAGLNYEIKSFALCFQSSEQKTLMQGFLNKRK